MTQGFFQFNNSIINEIINFSTSSFNLLFLSGEKGSSKGEIIEKVSSILSETNLIFSCYCFENSVIDDFLLNFYDTLRYFSLTSKISLKKFTAGSFKEKVDHYFKTIESNCIITIRNFEKIEKNTEIIDFLSHLASYDNIKIIVITTNPDTNLFRFKKVRMQTLKIPPIEKEEFKSRLTILLEPTEDEFKEKIYAISKGSELYLKMCIKYCNTTDTPIKDLINEFERKNESSSKMDFEEFLISKFISLTPGIYQNIFKTMCAISHPVSVEFLNSYNLANASQLEYLTKNFLVDKFKDELYVKDYFREYITKSFSIQQQITYYKNLVSIYENELKKTPKDRLLRLSRESIRKEIMRFNSLIPAINTNSKGQKTLHYLGVNQNPWKDEKTIQKEKLAQKLNKIKERKKILSNKETFTIQSKAELAKKNFDREEKENIRRYIITLINSSRDFTKQYRYQEAIGELLKAMEEDNLEEFKIETLTLLAKNYEYLNNYSNARKCYMEAYEFALKKKDSRACELEFSIAMTSKNLFQIEKAKEQFSKIALNQTNSQNFRAKAYLELGEIEEANSKKDTAIRCYMEALSLALGKNKELVCRCYWRLAVLYDENQDIENAISYYQKNYLTSSETAENKYYSSSLINLGLIYIEQSKYKQAIKAFKSALSYDSENKDLENMFFSQKELAKLYLKIDETSSIGYFKQALDSASKLNDNFKTALVYFEAGEIRYDRGEDEKALENFLRAKSALIDNPDDENIARINSRIKDIEIRLDNVTFNLIVEKYAK